MRRLTATLLCASSLLFWGQNFVFALVPEGFDQKTTASSHCPEESPGESSHDEDSSSPCRDCSLGCEAFHSCCNPYVLPKDARVRFDEWALPLKGFALSLVGLGARDPLEEPPKQA